MTPAARNSIIACCLSAAGLVAIVNHENYVDTATSPVKGDVPTYGFGTTLGPDGKPLKAGEKTTPPKALALALRDVTKFEGAIKRCVHVPLAQVEYDAYVSLAYNIGERAFCESTLVRKLNAGDYPGACAEISKWDKFHGVALAGLTKRRAEERARCEGRS